MNNITKILNSITETIQTTREETENEISMYYPDVVFPLCYEWNSRGHRDCVIQTVHTENAPPTNSVEIARWFLLTYQIYCRMPLPINL